MIVADVFDGARHAGQRGDAASPPAARRVLRPGGLLAMNLTDLPPLAYSRIQAATLRAAFGDVALIAEPAMLRGRRAGNVMLVRAVTCRLITCPDARPAVLHGATADFHRRRTAAPG